jgi:cyclopropane fatty-acyl-phospholipid synthase-like methyltransferase
MVLHSIGRSEGPNVTSPWIEKYIFPDGYVPSLSEVLDYWTHHSLPVFLILHDPDKNVTQQNCYLRVGDCE